MHLNITQCANRGIRQGFSGGNQAIHHGHHRQRRQGPCGAMVEQPVIALRIQLFVAGCFIRKLLGRRRLGTGNNAHAEVLGVINPFAINPQPAFSNREATVFVFTHFRDAQLAADHLVFRHDLATIFPGDWLIEHQRLETGIGDAIAHAGFQHVELQQLAQRLDAQRARLNRILEEVGLEEPFIDIDSFLTA